MCGFPIPEPRPHSCGPVPTLGNALLLPALSPHQPADASIRDGAFRPRQTFYDFLVPTRGLFFSSLLLSYFVRLIIALCFPSRQERTGLRHYLITSLVILLVVRFATLRCHLCWQFTKLNR